MYENQIAQVLADNACAGSSEVDIAEIVSVDAEATGNTFRVKVPTWRLPEPGSAQVYEVTVRRVS